MPRPTSLTTASHSRPGQWHRPPLTPSPSASVALIRSTCASRERNPQVWAVAFGYGCRHERYSSGLLPPKGWRDTSRSLPDHPIW